MLNAGEFDDPVELAHDFGPTHPEHSAAREDVLTAGQPGWKPVPISSRLPTRPSRAVSRSWAPHASEDLQQGALAGAVATDHADDIAALDLELNAAQRPGSESNARREAADAAARVGSPCR